MLRRGHVDLAVLDNWPEVALRYPPGITHVEIGRDVADLIVPAGHRFATDREIRLTRARDEHWISTKAATSATSGWSGCCRGYSRTSTWASSRRSSR